MKDGALILFTNEYPLGNGEPYIRHEMRYLMEKFEKIIIVTNWEGDMSNPDPNIPVFRLNYNLSIFEKFSSLKYVLSNKFWQELNLVRSKYKQDITLMTVKTLLVALFTSDKTAKFIDALINRLDDFRNSNRILLYSYWSNNMALGIAEYKSNHPEVVAISRAHRWDVYAEENKSGYLPLRSELFKNMNGLFFISEHARDYFIQKTGGGAEVCYVSRLGIEKGGVGEQRNKNHNPLHLLSCSAVIPRKRLEMIVDGLACCSSSVFWTHIGGGPELSRIKIKTEDMLKQKNNIQGDLLGEYDNSQVYTYYQEHCPDVLIILSDSEGIPVCIMEAMSFGVPVIATDVGGMGEIVNSSNGILLSADPSDKDIAKAIESFCTMDQKTYSQYQENAYSTWLEGYNSEKNSQQFAENIHALD